MPNNRRQRGDYFERRAREALEHHGWVVIRAAGSLGPADLVALKLDHPALLISCKLGVKRLRRPEAVTLIETAQKAGALPVLATRPKTGWVALDIVSRHTDYKRLGQLHMPVARPNRTATPEKHVRDHLDPPGHQLTIYDALPPDKGATMTGAGGGKS